MRALLLLLVLKNLKKYHKGDFAGHCYMYVCTCMCVCVYKYVCVYCMHVYVSTSTESRPQLPLNKAKNNYASFECGARVIETNEEAQVGGGRYVGV